MNEVMAVFRKEMKSSFNSPIAYIVALFFVTFATVWFFFIVRFFQQNVASLRPFFQIMPAMFSIIVPAVTMRSWAEEAKSGTAELLVTMPASEGQLVAGKFLSAFALVAVMTALTVAVPLCVLPLGRFDLGQIFAEYAGVLLMGAASVSIGLYVSIHSRNQISCFIVSVLILMALAFGNQLNQILPLPDFAAGIVNWISTGFHFESFSKGILDTRDLAYFAAMTAFFLFLSSKTLVERKWK